MVMTKFKNKYRVESVRLEGYDYSLDGLYFITIITGEREHFFGEIKEGEMYLSEIGKIAEKEWFETLRIRKDMNLQLHEFVVMPNHIHGIIEIGENKFNDDNFMNRRDDMLGVSHSEGNFKIYKNTFSSQSKNIASIIRGYKSSVTIKARKINANFSWQARFYDHVVRNNEDYKRISDYILTNPENWKEDRFY